MEINKEKLLKELEKEYIYRKKQFKKDSEIDKDFNNGYLMGYRHAEESVKAAYE